MFEKKYTIRACVCYSKTFQKKTDSAFLWKFNFSFRSKPENSFFRMRSFFVSLKTYVRVSAPVFRRQKRISRARGAQSGCEKRSSYGGSFDRGYAKVLSDGRCNRRCRYVWWGSVKNATGDFRFCFISTSERRPRAGRTIPRVHHMPVSYSFCRFSRSRPNAANAYVASEFRYETFTMNALHRV